MRIAAIYDIHGNNAALEAVVEEIDKLGVDKVVVGGDLAWGPQPRQVMDKLYAKKEDWLFIRGNSDREIFEQYRDATSSDDMVGKLNQWCIDQLTIEQLQWLDSLPFSYTENNRLFVHGSPRSDTESIRVDTWDKDVMEMVKNTPQSIVICGHTHRQFKRKIGRTQVINAGSVGLQSRAHGACWLLIDSDEYKLQVTTYDVDKAARAILASNAPYKEDFAEHIRNPPDEGP